MWQHYVYLHRKTDSGEPFYVGKGKVKRGRIERPHATAKRSIIWQRTAAKHGVTVELVASCLDDAMAQEIEKAYIKEIGRRDLGLGPLVNLTDGGDGHANLVISERVRKIRSDLAKRPRSEAWVASIRNARKNGGNGGVVKKRDKLPDWWCQRISEKAKGAGNSMYGRTGEAHPNRRGVVDVTSGNSFPTVTSAAAHLGLRMQTLHNMLTGFRPNSTSMRFA